MSGPEPRPGAGPRERSADWRRWVVYQVYPRSFADSDGDGVGDLRGVLSHLDYLDRLGVDVVWMSPVYRSPMDDNGYDISDYQDIDPLFGTLADLDELVAELHARGMKLVMDLVVNHTSDEHPWFVESRSSRDNPKRDWYWWRDPRPGHPRHAGRRTHQLGVPLLRPHLDLGREHRPVLPAHLLRQAARPELGEPRGPPGRLRHDAVVAGPRRGRVPDGRHQHDQQGHVAAGHGAAARVLYGPGDQHFTFGPRNHEFLAEMYRDVFAGRDVHVLTVGEMPGVTIPEAVLFTDPARHELDMVFQFEHVRLDQGAHKYDLRPLRLPALKASMAAWQTGLAERGWNSLYLGNHDQPRSVSRFGDDSPAHRTASAKTLATVLHLHRGTPYVYQGDELGMANAPFTAITDYRDIQALRFYAEAAERGDVDLPALLLAMGRMSRDQGRTPVQWDASPSAGFTTGTPWLAINPDHTQVNAAAQVGDPGSVFEHYRRLIALRHTDPVVTGGDFELLLPDHPSIWAFLRRGSDAELLVAANFSADVVSVGLPLGGDWADASVVLTSLGGDAPLQPPPDLKLRPWESVVWRRVRPEGPVLKVRARGVG